MVDTSHSSVPKRMGEKRQNGGRALHKEPSFNRYEVVGSSGTREAEVGTRTGNEIGMGKDWQQQPGGILR